MITKTTQLANLKLNQEQLEILEKQLASILDYVKHLDEVDISGVEPTYNVTMNKNITREDVVSNCLTQSEVTTNADNFKNGLFVTKGVFDGE